MIPVDMKNPMLFKPNLKLYVAMLLSVVGCMVWLYRCSHSVGRSGSSESGGGDTIDVAIEYSPLSLYMYGDTLGGFNHDLLMLIARKKGVAIKMHPMVSLSECLKRLDDGAFDVIAAQVPVTTDFKKHYLFSDSICLDRQVLVQRKVSLGRVAVKSQLDIAGKTLSVAAGSPVITRIQNLSRELGDSIGVKEEGRYGQEQLIMMVATGEIDYAVVSDRLAKVMVGRYPQLDISTAVSFNQFQSWVMRKDDKTLCDSLNKWLFDVRQTKEYKSLYDRYLK